MTKNSLIYSFTQIHFRLIIERKHQRLKFFHTIEKRKKKLLFVSIKTCNQLPASRTLAKCKSNTENPTKKSAHISHRLLLVNGMPGSFSFGRCFFSYLHMCVCWLCIEQKCRAVVVVVGTIPIQTSHSMHAWCCVPVKRLCIVVLSQYRTAEFTKPYTNRLPLWTTFLFFVHSSVTERYGIGIPVSGNIWLRKQTTPKTHALNVRSPYGFDWYDCLLRYRRSPLDFFPNRFCRQCGRKRETPTDKPNNQERERE